MSYVALWAHDGDYSCFQPQRDGYPDVEVLETLEDVQRFCVHVLRRSPAAIFRIFEINHELEVSAQIPDAIVEFRKAGAVT